MQPTISDEQDPPTASANSGLDPKLLWGGRLGFLPQPPYLFQRFVASTVFWISDSSPDAIASSQAKCAAMNGCSSFSGMDFEIARAQYANATARFAVSTRAGGSRKSSFSMISAGAPFQELSDFIRQPAAEDVQVLSFVPLLVFLQLRQEVQPADSAFDNPTVFLIIVPSSPIRTKDTTYASNTEQNVIVFGPVVVVIPDHLPGPQAEELCGDGQAPGDEVPAAHRQTLGAPARSCHPCSR
jgi:hypothetical protein